MQREVISGSFTFPYEQARDVFNFAAEFAASAPDELSVSPFVGAFPGSDPLCTISVVYSGPPEKADQLLAPIEKAGTVVRNSVKSWDYVALQKSGDFDDVRANGDAMKSGFLTELTPDLVRDALENFEPNPDRATWMVFSHGGGAIGRVAPTATAFTHREARHNFLSFVSWPIETDSGPHFDYLKRQWQVVGPYTSGFYINDLADETQAEIDANYGVNFERLVQVKNQYDPTNLFRLNANVRPTV
jgi:hypothetical protein